VVDSTFNKFGKKLPPVKTGQRFGEEATKNKKVGLFSERRFLIFTKKGPFEITILLLQIKQTYHYQISKIL